MENQEVKTAYQTVRSDIANLLGFFECELGKQPQTIQWLSSKRFGRFGKT